MANARLSAGGEGGEGESPEDLDELPVDMLENTALASARFDMIIKRLGAQPAGKSS